MPRTIYCVKKKAQAPGLEKPPIPGELGQRIYQNISKEIWQEWQRVQIMVINENKLSLRKAEDRATILQHMQDFLFTDDYQYPKSYTPPE